MCKEGGCKGRQKQAKIEILVKRKEEKGRREDNKLTIDSEKQTVGSPACSSLTESMSNRMSKLASANVFVSLDMVVYVFNPSIQWGETKGPL